MHLIKDENGNLIQHGHEHVHEHTHEHTHADGVTHSHAHTHESGGEHAHSHGEGCQEHTHMNTAVPARKATAKKKPLLF